MVSTSGQQQLPRPIGAARVTGAQVPSHWDAQVASVARWEPDGKRWGVPRAGSLAWASSRSALRLRPRSPQCPADLTLGYCMRSAPRALSALALCQAFQETPAPGAFELTLDPAAWAHLRGAMSHSLPHLS